MSALGRQQGQADAAVLEQDAEAVLRFRQPPQRLAAAEVQDETEQHEEKAEAARNQQGDDERGQVAGRGHGPPVTDRARRQAAHARDNGTSEEGPTDPLGAAHWARCGGCEASVLIG